MKLVRSFGSEAAAHFAAGLLLQRSIPCEVRGSAISEESAYLPELWVLRDGDLPSALDALRRPPEARASAWRCPSCREENEAAFDACWSCGTDRARPPEDLA